MYEQYLCNVNPNHKSHIQLLCIHNFKFFTGYLPNYIIILVKKLLLDNLNTKLSKRPFKNK